MTSRNVFALAALASLCPACRGLRTERAPEPAYEQFPGRLSYENERMSREWLRLGAGWIAGDVERDLDDAVLFAIDGGFDVARTEITPSVEIGGAYSVHHVSHADHDPVPIARLSAGMRLTWYSEDVEPYLRGGAFVRWGPREEDEPFDPYGYGAYVGLGIDWTWTSGMRLGPSVTWYRGLDDEPADEVAVLLGASFRL